MNIVENKIVWITVESIIISKDVDMHVKHKVDKNV